MEWVRNLSRPGEGSSSGVVCAGNNGAKEGKRKDRWRWRPEEGGKKRRKRTGMGGKFEVRNQIKYQGGLEEWAVVSHVHRQLDMSSVKSMIISN